MSLGQLERLVGMMDRDHHIGLVLTHGERLHGGFRDLGIVEIHLGAVVAHDLGGLACRKVEVDGVADGAELLRRDIAE